MKIKNTALQNKDWEIIIYNYLSYQINYLSIRTCIKNIQGTPKTQ